MPSTRLLLLISLAFLVTSWRLAAAPAVVIESVPEASTFDFSQAKPGDVLISWRPAAGLGVIPEKTIPDPFEWYLIELEELPRGPLVVEGERDGEPLSLELALGRRGAVVTPLFPAPWREIYLQGSRLLEEGSPAAAAEAFRDLAGRLEEAGSNKLAGWLHFRRGSVLARQRQFAESQAAFDRALTLCPGEAAQIAILDAKAKAFRRADDYSSSEEIFHRTLDLRRKRSGEGLQTAFVYDYLGLAAREQDRLEEAASFHLRALELRRLHAPGSLAMAVSTGNLANTRLKQKRFDEAAELQSQTLEIQKRWAPGSTIVSGTLLNLGNVYFRQEKYDLSEATYLQSLEIDQRLEPDSLYVAQTLSNLGNVNIEQGDLSLAETRLRSALVIQEKLAPKSRHLAYALRNLGRVLRQRGDLAGAQERLNRALSIATEILPEGSFIAGLLEETGRISWLQQDWERAEETISRSYELIQQRWPDSHQAAEKLQNLANVKIARGNPEEALVLYEKAARDIDATGSGRDKAKIQLGLAAAQRASGDLEAATATLERTRQLLASPHGMPLPTIPQTAILLHEEAELAALHRELEKAIRAEQRSIEIWRAIAPGSHQQLMGQRQLALWQQEANQPQAAAATFRLLLDALDRSVRLLGGSPGIRRQFRSSFLDVYGAAIETFLALGRTEEGFHTAERYRARSFLELLATRDLSFNQDLTNDLERRRRRNDIEYDRLQWAASEGEEATPEERQEILKKLQTLRQEKDRLAEETRRLLPRDADVYFPQPIDAGAAQNLLDEGTLLVEYSLSEQRAAAFVLTRNGPVESFPIDATLQEIRDKTREFVTALGNWSATPDELLLHRGRTLFDLLLGPIAHRLPTAKRLLIVPDGPLHRLPFTALRPPANTKSGSAPFLVETLPIHTTLSMTVYQRLLADRERWIPSRAETARPLIAFGDPRLPARDPQPPKRGTQAARSPDGGTDSADLGTENRERDSTLELFERKGYSWQPLPHSKLEVESVARLFPDSQSFLGNQASEERVKKVSGAIHRLHFATHAWLNEESPLDSALVLTRTQPWRPGLENGLLQVWEILEQLRFEADLVVLSACQSALGEEASGEGLIGLTRAFHHAGARSVVSTLWNVSDQVTAPLMELFYRGLAKGKSKDEALRSAQLALLEGPVDIPTADGDVRKVDASSPYFWAGFQISGDWR